MIISWMQAEILKMAPDHYWSAMMIIPLELEYVTGLTIHLPF